MLHHDAAMLSGERQLRGRTVVEPNAVLVVGVVRFRVDVVRVVVSGLTVAQKTSLVRC